jgi:DNA polymerase-3 subunit alpha
MAIVNNMSDIKQVSFFMEVNSLNDHLTVNDLCFLGWEHATIVQNRKDGVQVSFDLTKRIDLRAANKKALEN